MYGGGQGYEEKVTDWRENRRKTRRRHSRIREGLGFKV